MKEIITLILALTMLFGATLTLSSCNLGGGNNNGDNNNGGSNATEIVKVVDVKLTDEEYAFVAKKGNTTLVSSFNAFLSEIKSNGSFDALVAKYFEGTGERLATT